jgi:hypothetical protein
MPKAAEVHRIMSQALDGWLQAHGYRSQRGQRTFWARPCGPQHILLWIQLDKYGYDTHLGGKLWLSCCWNTEVSKALQGGEFVEPSTVCTPAQLDQWLATKRTVLDKILLQPDLGLMDDFFRRDMEEDKEQPYFEGSVAEMPYFDDEDVRRWGKLLLDILPALDPEMTRRVEQGQKSRGRRKRTKRGEGGDPG